MNAESRHPESSLLFQLRWTLANLRLHPARTGLTLAGVALVVALLVSLVSFHAGYRAAIRRGLEQLGFDVLVTAKGCPYEAATMFLRGGNIPMYLDEALYGAITADPAVESSTRLFLQVLPAGGGRYYFFLGVDENFRSLKPWLELQMGRWFGQEPAAGPAGYEVVLGYNVATDLGKVPGEAVEIPGLAAALKVAGILEPTGAQDDGTLFLPLGAAQKLFDRKDRLTGVGVKLRSFDDLPAYLERLYELPAVQVVTLRQAQAVLLELVATARNLLALAGALAALVAALALCNTLLMALLERRRELAVLRALGAGAPFLFRSVLLEGALVAAGGGLLGVLLAAAGGRAVESFLRRLLPFTPEGAMLEVRWEAALAAVGAATAAGLLCGLYPAWRAARTAPYLVMREEG